MLSAAIAALLVALCLHPFVLALSFSSAGLGVGGALSGLNALGISSSTGDITSAGTGGTGGSHNGANMHLSPVGPSSPVDDDELVPSPDAGSLPLLSGFALPLLERPQYAVPDYRNGAPAAPGKTVVKRKVKKVEHPVESPQQPPKTCWVVSKKCCYEEVNAGYECKDFYAYKYARCHPVIDYAEKCDDVKEEPAEHPKPQGHTKYEESIIKNYDANYGPHVEGYPETGESEYYETAVIPQKPHGVPGDPYPAPQLYEEESVTSESNSYAAGDAGYDAPPEPPMTDGAGEQIYDATPLVQETSSSGDYAYEAQPPAPEGDDTGSGDSDGYEGAPPPDTSSSDGRGYEGAPPPETSDNGCEGPSEEGISDGDGYEGAAPPVTSDNGGGYGGSGGETSSEGRDDYEGETTSGTSGSGGEGYEGEPPAETGGDGYEGEPPVGDGGVGDEGEPSEETSGSGDTGYEPPTPVYTPPPVKPESQTSDSGGEEPYVPPPTPAAESMTSASQSYWR